MNKVARVEHKEAIRGVIENEKHQLIPQNEPANNRQKSIWNKKIVKSVQQIDIGFPPNRLSGYHG